MSYRLALKLTLPIAFFGYAAFANVALFQSDLEKPDLGSVFNGGVSKSIDTLYRGNLPHRDTAVGWIGAARYVLLSEGRDGVVDGKNGWLFSDEEYRPVASEGQDIAEAMSFITDAKVQLAEAGATLVMVPLPSKLDISDDMSRSQARADVQASLYQDFMASLAQQGIAAVDTKPALTETNNAFFRTDTHWTLAGAKSTAQSVARSGLVPAGDQTFEISYAEPERFFGDLVSFVTSDTLAPFIGLGAETVSPYMANLVEDAADDGALDLFGSDGPVPYALVGTSYSANDNWSFVEALKLELSHDVLNYAQEGRGPVAPMRDYLAGLANDDVPEVVIWEFPVRYLTDPKLLEVADAS